MIKLDITTLLFFYILFSVIIILVIWMVFGYRELKKVAPKYTEYVWKCTVCAHTYVDSKHVDISACPLCGSYNKREDSVVG